MMLRTFVFWCHLVAGTTAGAVILIMSLTGLLLTYERQIVRWADESRQVTAPSSEARWLPPEALLSKVRSRLPDGPINALTLRSGAAEPAVIGAGQSEFQVDPYTGTVVGEGSKRARLFFRTVTDWHRALGTKGNSRVVGRAVTGICNTVFLFLVLSGLFIWWPRKISNRRAVRNAVFFRQGLSGKARDFSWHNVVGFWSAFPLLIIVTSGIVISHSWANNLAYRIFGEEPPQLNRGNPAGDSNVQAQAPSLNHSASGGGSEHPGTEGLDRLWERARTFVPGWRSISVKIPRSASAPITFVIDEGDGAAPPRRSQLTLDRNTGRVVRWEPYSGYSRGRRLRSFLRFAHTGEVAGIIGQTTAGLASAGAVVLVWTGMSLAFRRFRSRSSASSTRPGGRRSYVRRPFNLSQ